jgi:hypothetical protein
MATKTLRPFIYFQVYRRRAVHSVTLLWYDFVALREISVDSLPRRYTGNLLQH